MEFENTPNAPSAMLMTEEVSTSEVKVIKMDIINRIEKLLNKGIIDNAVIENAFDHP